MGQSLIIFTFIFTYEHRMYFVNWKTRETDSKEALWRWPFRCLMNSTTGQTLKRVCWLFSIPTESCSITWGWESMWRIRVWWLEAFIGPNWPKQASPFQCFASGRLKFIGDTPKLKIDWRIQLLGFLRTELAEAILDPTNWSQPKTTTRTHKNNFSNQLIGTKGKFQNHTSLKVTWVN